DAVADDDEVAPDDRRRGLSVMELVDRFVVSRELLREVDEPRVAEITNGFASRRVDCYEIPAAVEEDSSLSAVGPCGDAAVYEARAVRGLTGEIRFGVVRPELFPGVRVECDDAIVRRAEKQRVADHQRRRLEVSWASARRGVWCFARRPLPRLGEAG